MAARRTNDAGPTAQPRGRRITRSGEGNVRVLGVRYAPMECRRKAALAEYSDEFWSEIDKILMR